MLGETQIENVVTGTPAAIWNQFESQIGCTREEFDRYTNGASELHAVMLGAAIPYVSRIPLMQLEQLISARLVAPQSYCSSETGEWAKAVAFAALLHGNLRAHLGRSEECEVLAYSEPQMSFL